ncbi:hypothetical protein IC006_2629 [Sulfuracidifex tepidarius]|uniref:Uncharacterized protein n=1 Tax=Sulfuracidifex tepidarius TaxID=1294262 RepID=A0A510DYI5_9CREN|nr:hypothetical protein [Sulfuracidifex tepidarius]BBG25294.1 hypothetical protein IC006_2629 [Sulfuracidifex tepidarius]
MIKESIFLFLAVGVVMPYVLSGTVNHDYVVVDINSLWNGKNVTLSGNYTVKDEIINYTSHLKLNSSNYPSYYSMWCSEFSGDLYSHPNVKFTEYNGFPALEVVNGSSFSYFDLQYMIPLQGKLLYSPPQQGVSPLNESFYMKELPPLIENGYHGVYNEYEGNLVQGSSKFGNFIAASPDAKFSVGQQRIGKQNFLDMSVSDKGFAVLILNTTSSVRLSEISEVEINGTPYYIAVTGNSVSYVGNSSTSFPFQAFYLPNSGLLLIDYPYPGNMTVVFFSHSQGVGVSVSSKQIGNSQPQQLYFVIIPVAIIVVLLLILFLRRRKTRS